MDTAVAADAPLLELRGAVKRFGGAVALDGVDFDLRAGEIHALLGENGAGKSTLIKILAGIHRADEGEIRVDGQPARIHGVRDSDRLGIRVIHQELSLAPNLSVAENLYLGREPVKRGWLDRTRMNADAERLIRQLGMEEIGDVRSPVSRLSVARRQLVEIARALSRHARVLVLDEPTSALSGAETDTLFEILLSLRRRGTGIVYISHRLEEIRRIADRVTVLRDGRAVGTRDAGGLDRDTLIRWMIGRGIGQPFRRPASNPGPAALEVKHLRNSHINDVSFSIRRGEIFGIAGLVGAGRTELARALFGLDPIDSGAVRVDGGPVTLRGPADALRAGIALVPEDRRGEGLVMIQSAVFNLTLPWTRLWCRGVWPDWNRRDAIARRAMESFSIKAADPERPVDRLSGGNQQKVLLGRWMEQKPKILILDEPARGIDVGAREEMFEWIAKLAEGGMAVLLISSDLTEVYHMSHRIALYRDGAILGIVKPEDTNLEEIMKRLTGADAGENS